ncbi:hypothetical protein PCE1_002676 [Barthelona sp. PCE]
MKLNTLSLDAILKSNSSGLNMVHTYILKRKRATPDLIRRSSALGMDFDEMFDPIGSFLHFSILQENVVAVEALLECGCDVRLLFDCEKPHNTPIMLAIIKERLDIVKLLLRFNADPAQRNLLGECALHIAVHTGSIKLCRLLVDHDANLLAIRDGNMMTPLLTAIHMQQWNIVRLFMDSTPTNGLEVDILGNNLLHTLIRFNGMECFEYALNMFPSIINTKNIDNESALHIAVRANQFSAVKLLLKRDAYVWATIMQFFSEGTDPSITKLLENHRIVDISPSIEERVPITFLSTLKEIDFMKIASVYATQSYFLETLEWGINRGLVDVNSSEYGMSIVELGIVNNDKDLVVLCQQNGADFNAAPYMSNVPSMVHLAAYLDHLSILRFVLSKAVIARTTEQRRSFLHSAVDGGALTCVEFLLKNWSQTDTQNHIAFQLAIARDAPELARIFFENSTFSDLNEALIIATKLGSAETARLLLQMGAVSTFVDEEDNCSLSIAASNNHTRMITLLLKYTTDIKCNQVENALATAARHGLINAMLCLIDSGAPITMNTIDGIKDDTLRDIFERLGVRRNTKSISKARINDLILDLSSGIGSGAEIEIAKESLLSVNHTYPLHMLSCYDFFDYMTLIDFLTGRNNDIDRVDDAKHTPLLRAIHMSNISLVGALLENGAKLKVPGTEHAFAYACRCDLDNANILTRIIEHDPTVLDVSFGQGRKGIHIAAIAGNARCVNQLLRNHAVDANITANGLTALQTAIIFCHNSLRSVVKTLVQYGASTNVTFRSKNLWQLAMERDITVLQTVLRFIPLELRNDVYLIHEAIKLHKPSLVDVLFDNGANIDEINDIGDSPLHTAAKCRALVEIELLLDCGADPDAVDVDGLTPLHRAILLSNDSVVDLLLKHVSPKQRAWKFITPLRFAIAIEDVPICHALLQKREYHMLSYTLLSAVNNIQLPLLVDLFSNYKDMTYSIAPTQSLDSQLNQLSITEQEILGKKLDIICPESLRRKDELGRTDLHILAMDGDKHLEFLLQKYVEINADFSIQASAYPAGTALSYAAFYGNLQFLQFVYEMRSDLFVLKDKEGESLLHEAAKSDSIEALHFILSTRMIDINEQSNTGETALYQAVSANRYDSAKVLIQNGAKLEIASNQGLTPLLQSVKSGSIAISQLLLKSNASFKAVDREHNSIVHYLFFSENAFDEHLLKHITRYDVALDKPNKHGQTPLMLAVKRNLLSQAGLLLEAGAVNTETVQELAESDEMKELLGMEIRGKEDREIDRILRKNSKSIRAKIQHIVAPLSKLTINEPNSKGLAFIHKLIEDPPNAEILNTVIECAKVLGCDLNQDSVIGTPLHIAAGADDCSSIQILLQNGAFIEQESDKFDFSTPFLYACECGSINVAEMLVDQKCDIFIKNAHNNSALHLASTVDVLDLLIDLRLDINSANSAGETPVMSFVTKSDELFKRIIAHGADITIQAPPQRSSVLHACASVGEEEKLQFLLNKLPADIKDDKLNTVLHISAQYNEYGCLESVLNHEKVVFNRNRNGKTPLAIALANNSVECVEILLSTNTCPCPQSLLSECETPELQEMVKSRIRADSLANIAKRVKEIPSADRNDVKVVLERMTPETVNNVDENGRNVIQNLAMQHDTKYFEIFVMQFIAVDGDIHAETKRIKPFGTAMHCAAWANNVSAMSTLVKFGLSPIGVNKRGQNPLHVASTAEDCVDVCVELAKQGIDINATDDDGNTALHLATGSSNLPAVDYLLRNGANYDAFNAEGNAPVHCVFEKGYVDHIESLKLYKRYGALTDIKSRTDQNVLDLSVLSNSFSSVRYLLSVGFDLKDNITERARCQEMTGLVTRLLDIDRTKSELDQKLALLPQHTADHLRRIISEINEENVNQLHNGRTFLHEYSENPPSNVELVLDHMRSMKANFGISDPKSGKNALHMCAQSGNIAGLRYLVENNHIEVDTPDLSGETPLITAIRTNQNVAVRYLIKRGAHVDVIDNHEQTTLHHACAAQNVNVLQLLIDSGVDIESAQRRNRDTSLHICAQRDFAEGAYVLIKNQANVNSRDTMRRTPLMRCAESDSDDVCRVLLENDSTNVNAQDEDGTTSLEISVENESKKVARILLDHGADLTDDIISIASPAMKRVLGAYMPDAIEVNELDDFEIDATEDFDFDALGSEEELTNDPIETIPEVVEETKIIEPSFPSYLLVTAVAWASLPRDEFPYCIVDRDNICTFDQSASYGSFNTCDLVGGTDIPLDREAKRVSISTNGAVGAVVSGGTCNLFSLVHSRLVGYVSIDEKIIDVQFINDSLLGVASLRSIFVFSLVSGLCLEHCSFDKNIRKIFFTSQPIMFIMYEDYTLRCYNRMQRSFVDRFETMIGVQSVCIGPNTAYISAKGTDQISQVNLTTLMFEDNILCTDTAAQLCFCDGFLACATNKSVYVLNTLQDGNPPVFKTETGSTPRFIHLIGTRVVFNDGTALQIFDINTAEVLHMVNLPYVPSHAQLSPNASALAITCSSHLIVLRSIASQKNFITDHNFNAPSWARFVPHLDILVVVFEDSFIVRNCMKKTFGRYHDREFKFAPSHVRVTEDSAICFGTDTILVVDDELNDEEHQAVWLSDDTLIVFHTAETVHFCKQHTYPSFVTELKVNPDHVQINKSSIYTVIIGVEETLFYHIPTSSFFTEKHKKGAENVEVGVEGDRIMFKNGENEETIVYGITSFPSQHLSMQERNDFVENAKHNVVPLNLPDPEKIENFATALIDGIPFLSGFASLAPGVGTCVSVINQLIKVVVNLKAAKVRASVLTHRIICFSYDIYVVSHDSPQLLSHQSIAMHIQTLTQTIEHIKQYLERFQNSGWIANIAKAVIGKDVKRMKSFESALTAIAQDFRTSLLVVTAGSVTRNNLQRIDERPPLSDAYLEQIVQNDHKTDKKLDDVLEFMETFNTKLDGIDGKIDLLLAGTTQLEDVIAWEKLTIDDKDGGKASGFSMVLFGEYRRESVAVKLAKQQKDEARILREYETLKRLKSSGLVRVFGITTDPSGRKGIVMQRLRSSLDDTHTIQRLNILETVDILLTVSKTLVVCCTSGVFHRNLNPSNILLDRKNNAFISDFNIAKDAETEDNTLTVGLVDWTAPELLNSSEDGGVQQYSEYQDVYSFGLLALYLFSHGKSPKVHTTITIAGMKHSIKIPNNLESNRESLQRTIASCLDPDPKNRPNFEILYNVFRNLEDDDDLEVSVTLGKV